MKALVADRPQGPTALRLEEIPDPETRPGELRVRVTCCGLNFTDLLLLRNAYQVRAPFPFIPGGELSGVVISAGNPDFPRGCRVMVRTSWGGLGEVISVSPDRCFRIPDGIGDESASILQFSYATAWYALTMCTTVVAGSKIAVLGAGGGVGRAAIAVIDALGATPVAVTSQPDSIGNVANVIKAAPNEPNALTQALKSISPEGLSAVVDPVGGTLAEAAMRALGPGGDHLVIGFAAGIPKIGLNLPLLKGFRIVGVSWGDYLNRNPDGNRAMIEDLMRHVTDGRLTIEPPQVIGLDEARETMVALDERRTSGKWTVRLSDGKNSVAAMDSNE